MKINRNNYEIWFLNYFEGRLSAGQVSELMEFLELHYDMKEEFDAFENIALPPAKHVVFDAKENMKKSTIIAVGPIHDKNYQEYFVGDTEGELTREQTNQLAAFIERNQFLKKELDLFRKTKVAPDHEIIFEKKECLKKSVVIPTGSVNEKNYSEYFIAATEGDLTILQHAELGKFLDRNPQLLKELKLFKQIKLTADASILFDRKQQIKRPVATARVFNLKRTYYPVSIAASVIIMFTIYLLLHRDNINSAYTAQRNEINIRRNVSHKSKQPGVTPDFSANQNYTNVNKGLQNNLAPVISEYRDFQFAVILKLKAIPNKAQETGTEFAKITFYQDFYEMMQRKRNEAEEQKQKQDESKYMSLIDFALFRIKKYIAPNDKKEEITPQDHTITLWDIADASVGKLNKLTGAKARLDHKKDKSGFTFALGNKFEISRSKADGK